MGGIVKAVFGGGSSEAPQIPDPIDPGKSMGEYLFGQGFQSDFSGITDPRLQQKLLESEGRYRPQYSALELADINTMWEGFEDVTTSPQYQSLKAELAGLEAGAAVSNLSPGERRAALGAQYDALRPSGDQESFGGKKSRGGRGFGKDSAVGQVFGGKKGKDGKKTGGEDPREAYIRAGMVGSQDREARIAQIKTRMGEMEKSEGIKGYKGLLADAARQSGMLEREMLELQRADDVSALQKFAPQVVEAYRAADPYSTGLAEQATDRAQLQAASAAEQQLQAMGMSLSDLSPTEQEALLSQRGMEFAASTGELTPLEQRRAQQSARQASVSRGRGMDQSALYGEMQSRMSQEMDKQGREIAMGSQLLGQQAGLRGSRLGQGAGMLTSSEALAAQRRGEYGQNLQQAFGMNRQLAGDVGMTILGRPSSAIGLGQSGIGAATNLAAGPMGPQLFDPNVGINLALQQRGQDVTFQGMQAQANAAQSAGGMGMLGNIAGGFLAGR